jgi:hypothetical protein
MLALEIASRNVSVSDCQRIYDPNGLLFQLDTLGSLACVKEM